MCIPFSHRIKGFITFKKYWRGQIWKLMFMHEYGIELDFRSGDFLESMLNAKEKIQFRIRKDLLKRKN